MRIFAPPALVFCTLLIAVSAPLSYAQNKRAIAVISTDFGEAWPLTVYSGMVNCVRGTHAIFLHLTGIYAMNGIAKGFAKRYGYKDIVAISKPHPLWPDVEADISPLLKVALRNCG